MMNMKQVITLICFLIFSFPASAEEMQTFEDPTARAGMRVVEGEGVYLICEEGEKGLLNSFLVRQGYKGTPEPLGYYEGSPVIACFPGEGHFMPTSKVVKAQPGSWNGLYWTNWAPEPANFLQGMGFLIGTEIWSVPTPVQ
jgi:hypothetical protein